LQNVDGEAGVGWTFTPVENGAHGIGGPRITGPIAAFDPPSFTGTPFDDSAYPESRSLIFQEITEVVPGQIWSLTSI